MDISKLIPAPAVPAAGSAGVGSALERGPGAAAGPATAIGDRGATALPDAQAAGEDAGIRPLDAASALKILIAEVRLALTEAEIAGGAPDRSGPSGATGMTGSSGAAGQSIAGVVAPPEELVPQAARALVELLLGFTPAQEMPVDSLEQSLARLRGVMDAAAQSAVERVAAWRDTPPAVPDALRQAQALAAAAMTAALAEEMPAGILARPEWLGLAPRLAQLRRRLRRRKLLLTDVDADHLNDDTDAGPKPGRR